MFFKLFNRLYQLYLLIQFKKNWRRRNSHNFTTVKNIFSNELVSVGRMTYGVVDVSYFSHPNERLQIGNFVSIANDVLFILGGNHQINCLTTYPLYSMLLEKNPLYDATTKGAIVIEDEVWIGTNSIILSGVRVGKGAIIASGAIVTKDVPSYAIVGGNPARVLRYRFNELEIKEIAGIFINDIPHQYIVNNIEKFYSTLDINSNFIKELKSYSSNN